MIFSKTVLVFSLSKFVVNAFAISKGLVFNILVSFRGKLTAKSPLSVFCGRSTSI